MPECVSTADRRANEFYFGVTGCKLDRGRRGWARAILTDQPDLFECPHASLPPRKRVATAIRHTRRVSPQDARVMRKALSLIRSGVTIEGALYYKLKSLRGE